MSNRAKRLKKLNLGLVFLSILAALFAIGFATRVSRDWKADPIKDIDDGRFNIAITDQDKLRINYSCDGEFTSISYDIESGNYTVTPIDAPIAKAMTTWFDDHDRELFSISVGAPFVLGASKALHLWTSHRSDRLQAIRQVQSAETKRLFTYALLTFGGYLAGDYVGSLLHAGCYRARNSSWLQRLDWKRIVQNTYVYTLFQYGECIDSHIDYVGDRTTFRNTTGLVTEILSRDNRYPTIGNLIAETRGKGAEYSSKEPSLNEIRRSVNLLRECKGIDQASEFSKAKLLEVNAIVNPPMRPERNITIMDEP